MKKPETGEGPVKMINEPKLDLACGDRKTEGFYGIDVSPDVKPDAVVDLTVFPWPIVSDSVDEIICNHYVEHTPDLMKFMNEVYRILKPGGKIKIVAPYWNSIRCWQDPTHLRAISEASFYYYNKKWREDSKLTHYPITCDFDFTYGYDMAVEWANRSEEARNFAIKHYVGIINDIHVVLTSRKPTDK
jgi:predicted SAM-dependent methyltransferase